MSSVWIIFFLIYGYYGVAKSIPMKGSKILKEENKSINAISHNQYQSASLGNIDQKHKMDVSENSPKIRIKRQNSGAGKFAEAAKMPQIKILRLILQMIKNLWDTAYVGGTHPLHPNVPKAIVALYKEKVVEFFIPDVGNDPNNPSR